MSSHDDGTFGASRLAPRGKNVLLLQGPNGPFFRRLAKQFTQAGAKVTKVNFCAGDAFFYLGRPAVPFRGQKDEWPDFLRRLVVDRRINVIYLFGDCRPHHRVAVRVAGELGIPVYVFEEGYLRPQHVTLERGGVNGYSSMSKDPDFYRREGGRLPEPAPARRINRAFAVDAWYTTWFAIIGTIFGWTYPRYRHHRNINFIRQMCIWVWGALRKYRYLRQQRSIGANVSRSWSKRYYFVPLQVHCDFQFRHAPFESMEAFMEQVVMEFAEHADSSHLLLFKHHPHDRAYTHYGAFLDRMAAKYGVVGRIVYCHDLHLPTLLRHAIATVTMNSTVGYCSLREGTPVKALGTAIYNFPGMTYQGQLRDFFRDPGQVDKELVHAFTKWILANNQFNGTLHRRLHAVGTPTGLFDRYSELRGQNAAAPVVQPRVEPAESMSDAAPARAPVL